MKPGKLTNHIEHFLLTAMLSLMAACSGGGPWGAPVIDWSNFEVEPLPEVDGIWRGIDSGGRDVLMLVTSSIDSNKFHFVDGFGSQGTGRLFLYDGSLSDFGVEFVPLNGQSFDDGTNNASCDLEGSYVEGQSLAITKTCVTNAGFEFQENFTLEFDALYNRGSSLEALAGLYESPTGNVLNIAADGAVFLQEDATGCITNGQFDITVTSTNMYLLEYRIDNCAGPDASRNGSVFSGLAILDDNFSPEMLEMVAIGDTGGSRASVIERYFRL